MVRRSSSGPAVEELELELDDRVDGVEDATPGHMHILTLWQDADADPVHKHERSAGAAPLQRCRAGTRFFSDMEPGGFRQRCFVKSALVFVEMSLAGPSASVALVPVVLPQVRFPPSPASLYYRHKSTRTFSFSVCCKKIGNEVTQRKSNTLRSRFLVVIVFRKNNLTSLPSCGLYIERVKTKRCRDSGRVPPKHPTLSR
jgi:hypothetical protein